MRRRVRITRIQMPPSCSAASAGVGRSTFRIKREYALDKPEIQRGVSTAGPNGPAFEPTASPPSSHIDVPGRAVLRTGTTESSPASSSGTQRITTALLLAAGTGSRLQPLTHDAPKCLTEVNGTTILERLIRCLRSRGFKRVVVVVGHLGICVRKAFNDWAADIAVEFIHSPKYRTTNNIYSLWLARRAIPEPFLLIESDLVFDPALLDGMLELDRIAVSRVLPWMNGTTVALDRRRQVTRFRAGVPLASDENAYKTVNMYSFSPPTWRRVADRLDEHVSAGRVGGYYETVIAELVAEGSVFLQAVLFDNQRWYEIDTLEDLHEAERLFPRSRGTPAPF